MTIHLTPRAALTPADRTALVAHKPAVLAALAAEDDQQDTQAAGTAPAPTIPPAVGGSRLFADLTAAERAQLAADAAAGDPLAIHMLTAVAPADAPDNHPAEQPNGEPAQRVTRRVPERPPLTRAVLTPEAPQVTTPTRRARPVAAAAATIPCPRCGRRLPAIRATDPDFTMCVCCKLDRIEQRHGRPES
jgi:hypothetical protein